jgi:RNA polymerase sigma-70 factor (ECF subfamily)
VKPPETTPPSDAELLDRFYRDKDTHWLGLLLQRYTLMLLGVCMKYLRNEEEARDSVQQVFLKVLQELPKYRVDYFKSWLYMVAKNHCLMRLRERQGRPTVAWEDTLNLSAEDSDRESEGQRDLDLERLEEGLTCLADGQRQCLTLFYLQKKSYQEISVLTGFSLLQVKSHIQNGKRNLRIWFDRNRNEKK